MTEKQLEKIINNFVKLNPKTNIYPQKNKKLLNDFLIVKNLFKSNLHLLTQGNYDKIFSNKDGKFLLGKNWLEILISSDSIIEYYTNLRRKYEICDQKKLKKNINDNFKKMLKNIKNENQLKKLIETNKEKISLELILLIKEQKII